MHVTLQMSPLCAQLPDEMTSPAQTAWVGTCVQFPASECGQAYGPCSAAQIGSTATYGGPSDLYQECPDSTGCPSG